MKNRTHLKVLATKRIEYLHDLLEINTPVKNKNVIEAMENIAIRFDITLSPQIKRSYCKSCKTPYGLSSRVRCKKGRVIITCLVCGDKRRFPVKI